MRERRAWSRHRPPLAAGAAAAILATVAVAQGWSVPARAGIIASLCVLLWLTEWVPVWLPTVVLWAGAPLLLGTFGPAYHPQSVLGWSAEPVLLLFIGGFSLAAAAQRRGLDRRLVAWVLRLSDGDVRKLVALAAVATAVFSMWMSNVAAAALVIGALHPVWSEPDVDEATRRSLLLTVALAADVGGIATPIGSGPNGIALAAVQRSLPIGFVDWMAFAMPLAAGLLIASVTLVLLRLGRRRRIGVRTSPMEPMSGGDWRLCAIFGATIALWLTEWAHGAPSWLVAVGAVGSLLVTGLLGWRDIRAMQWGTLLLIAGGIGLGALLDRSGVVRLVALHVPFAALPHVAAVLVLCLASAMLAAVMSNTGTAALLIPLAATIDPSPSTAVLVAIACSLGIPFVISTPQNAMAVAARLQGRDLLVPGLILMLGGSLLVALTGPWVLGLAGIP